MTIQVGHPHECPTFFLSTSPGGSQRVYESTSLQVGESTSWCPIGRISPIRPMPPNAKALLRQNLRHLRHISIIISVRYSLADRKNRPFGSFFGLVWVIIKSGVGVAYFKKLSYFCDSFLDDSMLFGLLMNS